MKKIIALKGPNEISATEADFKKGIMVFREKDDNGHSPFVGFVQRFREPDGTPAFRIVFIDSVDRLQGDHSSGKGTLSELVAAERGYTFYQIP